MIIKTDGLNKVYILGKVQVLALKEVSLSINKGIFLGVTGSSGSGKSTLLNLLGGLDTPTSGTIEVYGKLISEMNKEELALYRRYGVGMIFQSFNLIPSFSALDNVGLPLFFAGVTKKERKRKSSEVLERVGLFARRDHRPSELSGGEQQRVALARAMINQPQVLFADEPTGNLDSRTSRDIVQLLANLNKDQGITVVMVSHEEALLQEFSDEMIHLLDGEVVKKERIR